MHLINHFLILGRLVGGHNHISLMKSRDIKLLRQALSSSDNSLIDAPAAENVKDPLDSSSEPTPLPKKFNNAIRNRTKVILTKKEKQLFIEMSQDEENQNLVNCSQCLEIRPSKFGYGVFSKSSLESGAYLGNYGGNLARNLPEDCKYSFEAHVTSKPLFVDSEKLEDRSILRYVSCM